MEHYVLLTLFAAWCFVVAVVGGLLGLVLGNLRLPFTLAVASSPVMGVGANIAISGVTAGVATLVHRAEGRIDRRIFLVMTPTSVGGVLIGTAVAHRIPGDALLLLIGALLVWFGIRLLWHRSKHDTDTAPKHPWVWIGAAGVGIGILAGIVGLILGALRMPTLLRAFPGDAHRLVGTNLAVGFVLGIVGGIAHGFEGFDPDLLLIGAAASAPGAVLGARFTGRLNEAQLIRGIGVMLVVSGLATAARVVG